MKSVILHHYLVDVYRYLTLVIILACIQTSLSAVLRPQDSVSLYTANDKVVVLTSQNFSSTVYRSKTAWLIEFYASWCGHCQSYANTYREVAIDTWGWKTVVRIGAINCYAEENSPVCDQHNVMAYPTLQLIPPGTFLNSSKAVRVSATDAKSVERELIKNLDELQRTDKNWPHFQPINRMAFDDIYARVPSSVKLVLLVIEKRDDFTGRQIMLDFSKYHDQLAIFRTTTDGKLWYRFQLNITDLPVLLMIHRNRTTEAINTKQTTSDNIGTRNLFNYAIRSYIHDKKLIDNFDDRDLEEIIHSRKALKHAETLKISSSNDKETHGGEERNPTQQKLYMVDLETALSYMLRREIPRMKDIQGETYDALLHWLTVLTKYFPGRKPVMTYLNDLLSKISQQPNDLTGKQFREFADINTPTSYLPYNQVRYQHCAGSSPQYRGYPCALWLLFHTLTVSQVQSESRQKNIIEVPSAVKQFVKHFFGCRHCSENFMNETKDLQQLDSTNKHAAVIYLWKIHNHVNERLHGDETQDPKHPKIQFPSDDVCSKCRSNDHFDETTTLDFLLQYYSKDNLDLSSVGNFTLSQENKEQIISGHQRKASIDQYSMIEITDDSKQQSGVTGFLTSTIQRFPLYSLICVVIVVIFARKRYCKAKRKRYTL